MGSLTNGILPLGGGYHMAKLTALLVVLVLLSAIPANAQNFVGFETQANPSGVHLLLDSWLEKTWQVSDKQKLGLFEFSIASTSGFDQIYAGPAWYPRDWVQLTIGVGTEHHEHPWRVGGYLAMFGRLGTVLIGLEDGGSGSWYLVKYTHKVSDKVSVGVYSRRFNPTGGVVEVQASKRYTVWTALGVDIETHEKKAIIGLNVAVP